MVSANFLLPGLYLHFPYCRSRCGYCAFFSGTDLDTVSRWRKALFREAEMYITFPQLFDTMYWGGGTPSVLDSEILVETTMQLKSLFCFEKSTEITVEMNPDDVSLDKCKMYLLAGINRISVGVQSLDDRELKRLGRRHDAATAIHAMEVIRTVGFRNFGVDVIIGIPGGNWRTLKRSLDIILAFAPEHLSCYLLTLEPGTPLSRRFQALIESSRGERFQTDLYLKTSDYLRSRGYIHYEVSNFAVREDRFSRHNLKYWRGNSYLGLGPAAHSFHENRRWWNVNSHAQYWNALQKGCSPVKESEHVSPEQRRVENIMLGFRTLFGVSLDELSASEDAGRHIELLMKRDWVRRRGKRLVPTPQGFLMADAMARLFIDS